MIALIAAGTSHIWWGVVTGTIGTVLGVANFWRTVLRERRSRLAEDEDLRRWFVFVRSQRGNAGTLVIAPATGSAEHRWAERMVARQLLRRERGGAAYTIADSESK